jgi:hypothetical protein
LKYQSIIKLLYKDRFLYNSLRYGFNIGFCPICSKKTIFYKQGKWLRDQYRCIHCDSIPRFRAMMYILDKHFPEWRNAYIHESSPGGASSRKIAHECAHYVSSNFYPDIPYGEYVGTHRNENLETQTFEDASFDIIITQDVMEHVLSPSNAFAEIARTLKPGGAHVFTVPWYYWKDTLVRAVSRDGKIEYLEKPVYHVNPIDKNGSLVTIDYGRDFCDFIYQASNMSTTVIHIKDVSMGIEAEFIEVFISRKP